jgi:hypothetical protein
MLDFSERPAGLIVDLKITMATKKTKNQEAPSEGALVDAARSIGTALGTLSAKADELTTKAKQLHMPTAAEAKSAVSRLLTRKKPAAKKRPSAAKRKAPAVRKKK